MNLRHQVSGQGRAAGGFTLIEIIVVITIIAILTSLGLMVGSKVRQNAQSTATKQIIITLDQAISSLAGEGVTKLPSTWTSDLGNEYAVVDASVVLAAHEEPSQGLLLMAVAQHPALKETILRQDSRYVSNVAIESFQDSFPAVTAATAVKVPVLKDAWGQAIRFVHPRWDGGYGPYWNTATSGLVTSGRDQERVFTGKRAGGGTFIERFQRSYRPSQTAAKGDADEGLCTGGQGYFYSSGPDKDPGTRGDNVYRDAPPKFPVETANFQ